MNYAAYPDNPARVAPPECVELENPTCTLCGGSRYVRKFRCRAFTDEHDTKVCNHAFSVPVEWDGVEYVNEQIPECPKCGDNDPVILGVECANCEENAPEACHCCGEIPCMYAGQNWEPDEWEVA